MEKELGPPKTTATSRCVRHVRMQAGKPVFKTVFYFFVISVALFALDGFSHTVLDKMSCSHSTHMIERKEPSTDQRSLSGRSKLSGIKSLFNFCTCFLQASRLVITCAYLVIFFCDFSFYATSTSSGVNFKSISNVHQ